MKVHFIAIGGSAMHNLAISLCKKAYKVTGSDDEIFEPSKSRLKKYGVLPEQTGWHPDKINSDIDAVSLFSLSHSVYLESISFLCIHLDLIYACFFSFSILRRNA